MIMEICKEDKVKQKEEELSRVLEENQIPIERVKIEPEGMLEITISGKFQLYIDEIDGVMKERGYERRVIIPIVIPDGEYGVKHLVEIIYEKEQVTTWM